MMRISELPSRERTERYRPTGLEAKRDARLAKDEERDAFVKMAGNWQRLAELAEHDLKGENKG